MSNVNTGKKTRSAIADVVSREYTINLHKRVCCTPSLSSSLTCDDSIRESVEVYWTENTRS